MDESDSYPTMITKSFIMNWLQSNTLTRTAQISVVPGPEGTLQTEMNILRDVCQHGVPDGTVDSCLHKQASNSKDHSADPSLPIP